MVTTKASLLAAAGLAAVLVAAPVVPAANPPAAGARPRIGLVLGGGGARGCAHIGVLKVIEELRVPIDVIAGTSMGSLVGGLYAAGLSPEQIEEAVVTADWADLFADLPGRPQWPWRRKEDSRRYLGGQDIGLRGGKLLTPPGFVVGQKLNLLLRANTMNVAMITDFDRLPIPYRAVATDIANGEAVVLADGDLVEAIRASISIPGVFTPVERGGRLLVDGGLVDNVPVDVARAMGADIIIAVDVGGRFADQAKLVSALRISGQVLNILTRKNANAQLATADIVLTPDLKGMSASDFARAAEIILRGNAAARASLNALRALAVDDEAWRQHVGRQRANVARPIVIDSLQVEGTVRVAPERVLSRIRIRPGEQLDVGEISHDIMAVYDLDYFQQIDYDLIADQHGTGLIIRVKEKPWGPNFLRFNLGLRDDLDGGASYTFVANYTATLVNKLGAEWRTDVQIGHTNRVATDFYQPLGFDSPWFATVGAEAKRRPLDLFAGDSRVAQYILQTTGGWIGVGRELGSWGQTTLSLWRGDVRGRRRIGSDIFPSFRESTAGVHLSLNLDRLDQVDFPSRGILLNLSGTAFRTFIGSEYRADQVAADFGLWTTRGRQTWFGQLQAAGSGHVEGGGLGSLVFLGGLGSLSGYSDEQLYGSYAAVVRLGAYREIGRLPALAGGRLLAAAWVEAGNVWFDRASVSASDLKKTATLAIGAETFLGPAFLAVGTASGGPTRVYVVIGRAR